METEWVDFRIIKAAVTMQRVLEHYGLALKKNGHELRGKGPIHRGANNKHFTANVSKNVFKCFFAECSAHGNVLDFVAAMEHCSVRDAAVKLKDWFRVGDTTQRPKHDDAQQDEVEINKGIYKDERGAIYEVIGTATHFEGSESFVVYRELFDQFRLVVIQTESFKQTSKTSEQSRFSLVKKL